MGPESPFTASPGEAQPAEYLPDREGELRYPPGQTALLVVDPVNDFLSEGGAGWDMTRTTVEMNNVIENLQRAIEGARSRGIPVLFGPMAYTEEDYADRALHRRSAINRIMYERRMFIAGSWGADFHPQLQPADDDIVLEPHKGIDVFETDLPAYLSRLQTTHLVIAGMTANLCCEGTGRHAMERGLDVTYLSDAIGAENVMAYEASIRVNYPLIANAVITVDEFLSAVDTTRGEQQQVQPGDTVRGSDHGDIGPVEEVVEATDEHDACLRVPRGAVVERETYIPFDAVVRRSDRIVYINVPKLVIGDMPWDEPPTGEARAGKQGPRGSDVEALYRSRSPSARHESPAAPGGS